MALSTYTARAFDAYLVADAYRAEGIPVVIGGLHASVMPEEAGQHADAVVLGEGELLWLEVARDFLRGGRAALQPFYREAKPGQFDLAHAPMPRYDLLSRMLPVSPESLPDPGVSGEIHRVTPYNRVTVQTTRVCPVERLERLRRAYSRAVRPITYLPIYVKATALAIQRHPEANAILFRKPLGLRIVQFARVDVNLPITRRVGDRWITFIGTVRDAAAKSLAEIQAELREYQRCPPEKSFAIRRFRKFARMPLWMAQLIHAWMTWSPAFYSRSVGTCGLTLLDADWGEYLFPIAPTSVVFGIGAVRREPVVRGDAIVIGRRLKCCLMVDNFVISGLTGARLGKEFRDLLESGAFIAEEIGPARLPAEPAIAAMEKSEADQAIQNPKTILDR